MILDNVAAIFDNIFLIVNQLLLTLSYLFELNYSLVSRLLETVTVAFAILQQIFEGAHIAVVNFVDQYGELCTNLLHWTVVIINKIVEYALLAIVCALSFLNSGLALFLRLLQLPNLLFEKFTVAADKFGKSTIQIASFPIDFTSNILDGFSMIFKTIFDAWVYVLCAIFETFSTILTFALNSVLFLFRIWANGVYFLVRQPFDAVAYVLRGIYNVPMEAFIGLVICVCIYYLFKFGVIRLALFAWLRFCRNVGVAFFRVLVQAAYKARYYLLPLGEMIVMYTVPQVMIVFQVFRLAKRPIATLIACVRVLYNYYLRVTGRAALVANQDDAGGPPPPIMAYGNPTESSDRLMCIICQDAEKTVMAQPCRHLCMCRVCADEVLYGRRQCPMCRSYIREIVDVYL